MAYPKLKIEPVKQAILELSGNTAAVARKFGVTRQAVQQFIGRHQQLKAMAIEAKETMKDNVESSLYSSALAGEAWAVCFFLKTQAKDRGYVERSEITGADGEPLIDPLITALQKAYGQPEQQTTETS